MLRSEKYSYVSELHQICSHANFIMIIHYHGTNVRDITNLRKSLRIQNAGFKIVKNTLLKIAINKTTTISKISSLVVGPIAIIYAIDPIISSKIVLEFINICPTLKVVGGIMNNQVLTIQDIEYLATLSSLDELKYRMIRVLYSPMTRTINILQATLIKLIIIFKIYLDKNNNIR